MCDSGDAREAREANELVEDGVRELIIVAQDTTYYGIDLYGRPRLQELLQQLNKVDGLEWIRILYAYPMYFSDELIHTLADADKIIPYLDMPLQHANDRMLKRMLRKVDRASTEDLLQRLRSTIPHLSLRTTFIVGFPGETEADVQDLVEFVQQQRFERAGVFTYSFEPGTPSEKLPGHLPESVKHERRERVMLAQQEIALSLAQDQVGQETVVILDGPDTESPNHFLGRTVADAPEIDCVIHVKGKNLHAGDFVKVKVTGTDGYDLFGRAIGAGW